MYKAVIVDDEKIVRVALRTMVDWESEGYEICDAANNGAAALETIRLHNPDLVITDIVMPGIDGLDLIRSARESGFDGEFIILTNYQNFNYAIEALHNEVLDYIIKTDISVEIMGNAVRKAKAKLDSRRSSVLPETKQPGPEKEDMERLRRHISDPGTPFDLSESCLGLYTFLPSFLNSDPLDIPSGTLRNVVSEAAKELQSSLIPIAPDVLLILLPGKFAAELIEPENRTLLQIRKLVRLYMNTECGFVLTSPLGGSEDLDAVLPRCRTAAQSVLYDGFETLIRENSADSFFPGDLKGKKIYADFTHLINEYRYEEAKQYIRDTVEHCRKERICPGTATRLLRSILRLLHMDYGVWFSEEEQVPAARPATLEQYRQAIEAKADEIRSNKIDFSETTCRGEILRIDRFIRANLEHRITLSVLSSSINISENYISRLFKAETGINIIQYINLIKLEKAKELLLIKDNTVKQVSFMVGYDTPSYFNRLFNKLYGINPTDYIQMIGQLG
ncbi:MULTISPECIES: helix-turn-helix domain-containing protein [unclassified Oceanispirochaeta]|uniref:helix-turn-helix domain-containing protein n=1 Tax=unclassified Oceanispirochaeta TaxID=2635722 RepID=UPI001314FBD1|nr:MULTISPECIES: helix-turn-helix domain-containing protein [unclassified Oceanispirochaeta]MBF9017001.1 response regulator [Oceanispirochaeta sp. M2]NPD73364.1 response regulator [Oceanispirochaeta sp. M1]